VRAIRWSVRRAATEFGKSAETITRGLRAQGLDVGKATTWTTRQILAAITSDGKEARARESLARAELAEYELRELKGDMFRRESVVAMIAKVGLLVRQALLELPYVMAQRCNPQDPHLAKDALVRWVDDTLAALKTATLATELDDQEKEPNAETDCDD
jgi:hypothetical protein